MLIELRNRRIVAVIRLCVVVIEESVRIHSNSRVIFTLFALSNLRIVYEWRVGEGVHEELAIQLHLVQTNLAVSIVELRIVCLCEGERVLEVVAVTPEHNVRKVLNQNPVYVVKWRVQPMYEIPGEQGIVVQLNI